MTANKKTRKKSTNSGGAKARRRKTDTVTPKAKDPKEEAKARAQRAEARSARARVSDTATAAAVGLAAEASDRLHKLLGQAKEPLGLLDTLKEEGLARAGYLMGVAAGVASNVTKESVRSQAKEFMETVGLVSVAELDRLHREITDLRDRVELLEEQLGTNGSGSRRDKKTTGEEAIAAGDVAGFAEYDEVEDVESDTDDPDYVDDSEEEGEEEIEGAVDRFRSGDEEAPF